MGHSHEERKGNLGGRGPPFIDKCEAFLLQGRRLWGISAAEKTTSAQHYALETSLSTASPLLLHVSTQPSALVTCFNTALCSFYMFQHSLLSLLHVWAPPWIFLDSSIILKHVAAVKQVPETALYFSHLPCVETQGVWYLSQLLLLVSPLATCFIF
jgi:hypothetical protein